jgi:hypothetical protein
MVYHASGKLLPHHAADQWNSYAGYRGTRVSRRYVGSIRFW